MSKVRYVGALDQGTTSTRCIIFDDEFTTVAVHQVPHVQITPQPGWLEQNPTEIYTNVCLCITKAVEKLREKDADFDNLEILGITNQRETTVAWDAETKAPLCNAIVWSDARTAGVVRQVTEKHGNGNPQFACDITGLPASTYFSAFKMKWMLDNVETVQAAAKQGTLRFGTIDTWIMHKLTDGATFATDVTNASRTFLMDIKTQTWSKPLCDMFGIPMSCLPQIKSNSELFGEVRSTEHNVAQIMAGRAAVKAKILGSIGDQQAALFGNMCFTSGQGKCTYGTGCFLLLNCGTEVKRSQNGLLSTVAFKLGDQPTTYALEGSIAHAGAGQDWMRKNLHLFDSTEEMKASVASVPNTDGVVFVPAFSGLLAPYWDATARGTIVGLTLKTTKAHVARAMLEAIALQVRDVSSAMEKDSGVSLEHLRADGGMSRNEVMMQIQADILGHNVYVCELAETTALGAALCAGLAGGMWPSTKDVAEHAKVHIHYNAVSPSISQEDREFRHSEWKRALKCSSWAKL